MPTKQEVYDALCAESGPISAQDPLNNSVTKVIDNVIKALLRQDEL